VCYPTHDLSLTHLTVGFEKPQKSVDFWIFLHPSSQFAFRSGPVEEMHSKGKLTQKDMKRLNKFITNRIAGLLITISNGDIAKVLKVLSFYASLSSDWDSCKPEG
jgi:hypothetical protein